MNEPSPLLTSFQRAFASAPTVEEGLAAALEVLADHAVPPCRTPPEDFDLEEWGRYSKQASVRRSILALSRELKEQGFKNYPIRPC